MSSGITAAVHSQTIIVVVYRPIKRSCIKCNGVLSVLLNLRVALSQDGHVLTKREVKPVPPQHPNSHITQSGVWHDQTGSDPCIRHVVVSGGFVRSARGAGGVDRCHLRLRVHHGGHTETRGPSSALHQVRDPHRVDWAGTLQRDLWPFFVSQRHRDGSTGEMCVRNHAERVGLLRYLGVGPKYCDPTATLWCWSLCRPAGVATMYVRYKQVEALIDAGGTRLHLLNRVGLVLGCGSSLGMCVVANFQVHASEINLFNSRRCLLTCCDALAENHSVLHASGRRRVDVRRRRSVRLRPDPAVISHAASHPQQKHVLDPSERGDVDFSQHHQQYPSSQEGIVGLMSSGLMFSPWLC